MNHKAGTLFAALTITFLFLSGVACFDVSGDLNGTHNNLGWKFNDGKLTITGSEGINDWNLKKMEKQRHKIGGNT